MRKTTLIIALLSGFLLVASPGVIAQRVLQESDTEPSGTERAENVRNLRSEHNERIARTIDDAKQQRIKQQCENLHTRLAQIGDRVANMREGRGNLFDNLLRVLNNFSDRIEAAGLDATELNENITTLESLTNETNTLWDTYQTALEEAASARCDDDPGAQSFHEALETSRVAKEEVNDKFKEVRAFFTDTLKETLSDIRSQLSEDDAAEDETGDADETEDALENENGEGN